MGGVKPDPIALAFASARERGIELFDASNRAAWLERRKQDVTASVAGALFGDGVHEYATRYSLWASKSGLIEQDAEESPAMRRGRLLEPVALQLLREKHPTWTIVPCTTYFRDAKARIGATPDAFAIDPERAGFGVIQIKSVQPSAFDKKWRDEEIEELVPPLWIAIQAMVEATLSGASWGVVAPLRVHYGIDIDAIEVPMKDQRAIWSRLIRETSEFWRLVESKITPDPDFRRDAAAIFDVNRRDDAGYFDAGSDPRWRTLVEKRNELQKIEQAGAVAKADRRVVDAEIIHRLGNHAGVRLDDHRIVTARVTRKPPSYLPPIAFRTVHVKAAPAQRRAAYEMGDLF